MKLVSIYVLLKRVNSSFLLKVSPLRTFSLPFIRPLFHLRNSLATSSIECPVLSFLSNVDSRNLPDPKL